MTRSIVLLTDTDDTFKSIKKRFAEEIEIVSVSDIDYVISDEIYYILSLNEDLEREYISRMNVLGKKFILDYLTVWAIESELVPNDLSYSQLHEKVGSGITMQYIIDLLLNSGKKLCCIFGNCQITIVSRMLASSKIFTDSYIIIQLPEVFKVNEYDDKESIEYLLGKTDLFIYQHVMANNRFSSYLSSDNLLSFLNETCMSVCFPNSYVGMYYPQFTKITGEVIPDSTLMPYGDNVIQSNLSEMSFDSLLWKITSKDLYESDEISAHYIKCINELKEREEYCDFIISDYIQENYKKRPIGYSPNHPTNDVLAEVAKRIMSVAGLKTDEILSSELSLNQYEMIIYPSVSKHLGLEFNKKEFVLNRKITPKALKISQYVSYYLYYTNPSLFYGRLSNIDLSPALSISDNVELLENKIVTMNDSLVHINLLFRISRPGKVNLQLSRKCSPSNIISSVCITKNMNYLFKIMCDGHAEFNMSESSWAVINMMYCR